jgi:hypothetical protein
MQKSMAGVYFFTSEGLEFASCSFNGTYYFLELDTDKTKA